METRALGRGGPEVPVVCFGAWPIGGGMGAVPEEQAIAAVQAAIDVGMTFIDTAESYLASETLVGRAIKGQRHKLFLATKLSGDDHSREHIDRAVDNSLRVLGTDYIDLYQLHSPRSNWPIEQTMEHLLRVRDSGKVRFIGISNFSAEQTEEALGHGIIHSSQPRYNMLFREAEDSVLPTCHRNGIGVIAHSVLAKGMLTGRYRPGHVFPEDDERHQREAFIGKVFDRVFRVSSDLQAWAEDHGRDILQLGIAWTVAHPAVTSAIVGAKSSQQVRHNAKAADWTLTASDLREIDAIQGDLRLS